MEMTNDQAAITNEQTGGREPLGIKSLVIDWSLRLGHWSLILLIVGCSETKPTTQPSDIRSRQEAALEGPFWVLSGHRQAVECERRGGSWNWTKKALNGTPNMFSIRNTVVLSLITLSVTGCQYKQADKPAAMNQEPLLIDDAMQKRDWDATRAVYASGKVPSNADRFYLEPADSSVEDWGWATETPIFVANSVAWPFTYFSPPPFAEAGSAERRNAGDVHRHAADADDPVVRAGKGRAGEFRIAGGEQVREFIY